ncbi:Zn(II)2Cys6 transcription factor domain-containing protein ASCRUDRAFT_36901, partial [Ascoidea rubescens DSM 1968]
MASSAAASAASASSAASAAPKRPSCDNGESRIKKKRQRIPSACSACRKRKVKCDKKRPYCTSCLKNNIIHLCNYMEPTWS